jgi:tRNA threonylcarbamoyl adenosine modification protein YeaZ
VAAAARPLLAVDTSSNVVSAALVDVADARVLAVRDERADNRHGELLATLIDEVLREATLTPSSLVAVAAGLGPGPFTGLRVGVVTASSLADALGVPAYGACSLDAIARSHAGPHEFLVCTDARRKQVYWARYDAAGSRIEGPDIATAADLASRYADRVPVVVGIGVALYPQEFSVFDATADATASASDVAHLVATRVRDHAPSEVLEPMYLRRPDASPPGRPKPVLPA